VNKARFSPSGCIRETRGFSGAWARTAVTRKQSTWGISRRHGLWLRAFGAGRVIAITGGGDVCPTSTHSESVECSLTGNLRLISVQGQVNELCDMANAVLGAFHQPGCGRKPSRKPHRSCGEFLYSPA